jgi:hypothetical protein
MLYIQQDGTNIVLTWIGDNSVSLLGASSVLGPWQTMTNASSPYVIPTNTSEMLLFRLAYPMCTNFPCPSVPRRATLDPTEAARLSQKDPLGFSAVQ